MGKIFVTADLHFNDPDIILYENRPFEDEFDMNSYLIKLWNITVGKKDTVYILGDFVTTDPPSVKFETFYDDFCCLNGEKFLIRGNHDCLEDRCYESIMKKVYDHPIIINDFIILSHKPMYLNKNMPYINIFGHVHRSPLYRDISTNGACVSVERTDYRPIELNKILNRIEEEKKKENQPK